MCSKELLNNIDELISCMDSFQQDNGELRYQFTVHSYAQCHKIIVNIFKSDKVTHKSRAVTFCVEDFDHLYETFELYTNKLYEEALNK
jgi:hypothetical protein